MTFKHLTTLTLASLLVACSMAPRQEPVKAPPSTAPIALKLIAFNDFHGNLKTPSLRVPVADASQPTGIRFDPAGGVEQFSALVQSLRTPNNAVISAGDMVGATPLLSALFNDEPTIEAMNLVGVDFHAVGNHEFDYGIKHLKRLQQGGCKIDEKRGQPDCGGRPPYKGARFPFLAANVIETETGKPLFPPYGIKEFEGVKVAFIGMTLQGTPSLVRPGGTAGVTFRNEVETANALVPELRKQGIEAIVVLLHEGGEQAWGINDCKDLKGPIKAITEQLDPAIDIVVSAHTHRFYVCEVAGKLLTSAGSYGTLITEIDVKIDRNTRDIIWKQAKNQIVNPMGAKDPALTPLIENYASLAAPLENRSIAKVAAEINMVTNKAGESVLGNLIADAQLAATAAPDKGGAVIAFNNPGSLRAPIIPGTDNIVNYAALFRVQPFQNDLITTTLTGQQIKNLLEQQFGEDRNRILGVSAGFSYTWDDSKPRGQKVIAESMRLNKAPVQLDLQYRVTANSFIAGGSEGFAALVEGADRQVGPQDLEALVQYLAAKGGSTPYTPPSVGMRINRLN